MRSALLILLMFSGCQCCGFTESYQDHVDHIADHEGHWDRWYRPGLDLTRIGHRDWCQNRINHWLCPCRCERPTMLPCGHQVYTSQVNSVSPQSPPVEPPPRPAEPMPFSPPETDSLPLPTLPDPLPVPEVEPAVEPAVKPTAFEGEPEDLLVPPVPSSEQAPKTLPKVDQETELLPWSIHKPATSTQIKTKPVAKTRNGHVIAPRPDNSALPEWARNPSQ